MLYKNAWTCCGMQTSRASDRISWVMTLIPMTVLVAADSDHGDDVEPSKSKNIALFALSALYNSE